MAARDAGSDTDSDYDFCGFETHDLRTVSDSISDVSDFSVSSVPSTASSDYSSDENDKENEDPLANTGSWSTTLTMFTLPNFVQQVGAAFTLPSEANEVGFLMKFFSDEVLDDIVAETNRYATACISKKPDPLWQPITTDELKAFFGLHVLLSVIPMPSYKMAWTTNKLFAHPQFGAVMTRNRFEHILKYFHVADVSNNPPRGQPDHDRLALIRPILDKIRQNCLQNYYPHKETSIDEAMIAYRGRLSFKQYLPAKPTKYGVKVWVRADPKNGYVNDFDIYTGKDATIASDEGGLGERVVKKLCSQLEGRNHHVYVDNFFSSPQLFSDLEVKGVYCCGTVRVNRKGLPADMKAKRLVKNQGDFVAWQKGNLTATCWKDKKQVNFLATNADPTEIDVVSRKQKDGSEISVACPVVCKLYGDNMFGVDRADQMRMQYPTCRKAVKWWKYVFWFLFDVCICNAYVCMRESAAHQLTTKSGKPKARTQLDFRMKLTDQLIAGYRGLRKRQLSSAQLQPNHWPIKARSRGRCRRCYQNGVRHEVSLMCSECELHLCVDRDCFKSYHEELLE